MSSSHGDDDDDYDSDDDDDDRKEGYVRGAIKMDTYKAYFTAANNKVYVIVVFLVFIVAQVTWSGTDYFLSEWYVVYKVQSIAFSEFSKKVQFLKKFF